MPVGGRAAVLYDAPRTDSIGTGNRCRRRCDRASTRCWMGHAAAIHDRGAVPSAALDAPVAQHISVSAGYFETFRVPLVSGRIFSDRDTKDTEPVILVNRDVCPSLLSRRRSCRPENCLDGDQHRAARAKPLRARAVQGRRRGRRRAAHAARPRPRAGHLSHASPVSVSSDESRRARAGCAHGCQRAANGASPGGSVAAPEQHQTMDERVMDAAAARGC